MVLALMAINYVYADDKSSKPFKTYLGILRYNLQFY